MQRNDFREGQEVYFGRTHGEKTLGKILKLNPKKAKVQTLENRGNGRGCVPGSIWIVPYGLLSHANLTEQPAPKPVEPLTYNQFDPDNQILEVIYGIYGDLSPENLTCDGELPFGQIMRRKQELERKLKYLQLAIGKTVTEDQIYQWHFSKPNMKHS